MGMVWTEVDTVTHVTSDSIGNSDGVMSRS
jgi:hypothetical protein